MVLSKANYVHKFLYIYSYVHMYVYNMYIYKSKYYFNLFRCEMPSNCLHMKRRKYIRPVVLYLLVHMYVFSKEFTSFI